LHDSDRRVTIPGFYDDVVELTPAERNALAEAPFDIAAFKTHLGIRSTLGEAGYSVAEHTSIRPTLDVNGIWSGYTGEGSKTVLPSKAFAKISMRLVPNQNAEKISHLFEQHFKAIAPDCVDVEVKYHHGGQPFLTNSSSKAYQAAELAIEQVFGRKPIPTREGGSIPILAFFQETLGQPIVLMGFGLNTDAIHSPNEHFGVLNFQRGIESIIAFCQIFAQVRQ
jgi:acetylornithine deacetylase/succinyl-diaminopimelate desuccinylase-like protein